MARLVYLGTPPAAIAPLEALAAAGHDLALVVSRADTRRGRGSTPSPSAVSAAARRLGIPVTDRLEDVTGAGAELGVVVAYGRIVPRSVLDALDMVNVHFSLLPRWRGAAPVERAILAGDTVTGVCIMRLEEGLDTGPVLARRELPMDEEHAGALTETLARLGASMLVELLAGGVSSLPPGEAQVGEPTYAAKIDPGELRIDWSRPAADIARLVRLDRAWTTFRGTRLRVLQSVVGGAPSGDEPGTLIDSTVVTGDRVIELGVVQPEGRRPMTAEQWRHGVRPLPGERLGVEGGRR
jgi:methionyl-tRNA formyltransferase